jgi:hypothetical protein
MWKNRRVIAPSFRVINAAVAAALVVVIGTRAGVAAAPASVLITEVDSSGSSATYAADWFELTNVGTSDVDVRHWKIDDNSNAAATAVALRGVTVIPAGKSAVFFEGKADGSTDTAMTANFVKAWFGTAAPAGLLVGAYGGTNVGLSSSGDAVNVFDAGGARVTGVAFGAANAAATFANNGRAGATTPPLPILSTLSVAGAGGAFLSASRAETGSPGAFVASEGR